MTEAQHEGLIADSICRDQNMTEAFYRLVCVRRGMTCAIILKYLSLIPAAFLYDFSPKVTETT